MEPTDLGGPADPGWTVVVEDADPRREWVTESLCTLADGRFGTRGVREEAGARSVAVTVAAGVYADAPLDLLSVQAGELPSGRWSPAHRTTP
jgi:trehalose/maltose hydrolase-like predicted phosphorylase